MHVRFPASGRRPSSTRCGHSRMFEIRSSTCIAGCERMRAAITLGATLSAAVALLPAVASAAVPDLEKQLAGSWRVVQVVVGPGDVQALTANDPAYMGVRLSILAEFLSWDKPGRRDLDLDDRCQQPVVSEKPISGDVVLQKYFGGPVRFPPSRTARSLSLSCNSTSQFGPERPMPLLLLKDGRIALPWYDNGLLVLRRE